MSKTKTAVTKTRKPLTRAQKDAKNAAAKMRRAAKSAAAKRAKSILAVPNPTQEADLALMVPKVEADAAADDLAPSAFVGSSTDDGINVEGHSVDGSDIQHAAPGRRRWWMTPGRMDRSALVAAVRKCAAENADKGRGWEYVIQSMTDADILALIGRSRSARGAIWKVGCHVLHLAREGASL